MFIDGEWNKSQKCIEIFKKTFNFIEGAAENGAETSKKRSFVPHNREDLLNKIESLKLADDEDGDDFSFDESDVDSDFEGNEFDDDDGDDDQE